MRLPYYKKQWLSFLLLLLGSCIEPYQPDVIQDPHNYLVVDGFINSSGPTSIRLSRTVNLDGATIPPGEPSAKVYIEEEGGPQFELREGQDGNYTSQSLQLNPARQYRLRIRTAAGKEYASAYVKAKITPPIDSITWRVQDDAVQLYVSTHDPEQNTRYYRWHYEETWEFTTPYYSSYEFKNNAIIDRWEDIYHCWRSSNSTGIWVASTTKLSKDVVSDFPLIKLPSSSGKIKRKYSILVKQYAQTKEAYEYAETLKKNTENIGTLFDPLPSQLSGNIKCITAPEEPVIGFIMATTEQKKRIFIKREQLPIGWRSNDEYSYCKMDTVLNKDVAMSFSNGLSLPIQGIFSPMGTLLGYTASSIDCVDCRLRGTNVKPAFWE